MSNITIKQVGITEQKERTWGRVYVDYSEDGEDKFAFKNWLKFAEKTFEGDGSFETEPAYTTFDSKRIVEDFEDVLDGLHDRLVLTTNSKYTKDYGTPSKILFKLIQDLDAGLAKDISERRGWYKGS